MNLEIGPAIRSCGVQALSAPTATTPAANRASSHGVGVRIVRQTIRRWYPPRYRPSTRRAQCAFAPRARQRSRCHAQAREAARLRRRRCGVQRRQLVRATSAFTVTPVAEFREPWAMAFLPDGRLLVTEKRGALKLHDLDDGADGDVAGRPGRRVRGARRFRRRRAASRLRRQRLRLLELCGSRRARHGRRGRRAGAARARAPPTRRRSRGSPSSGGRRPKVDGRGHYGHRIAFGPDGFLYISSGERQKFTPAQDLQQNLGKIVRLADDGSVPRDNPFAERGGVAGEIWSLGHRNPLGLAFDANGRLWNVEMGPRGGDELNLVQRGGELRLSRRLQRRSLRRSDDSRITTRGPSSTRRRCFGTP